MEATIKITVTTIIISRSEKPSLNSGSARPSVSAAGRILSPSTAAARFGMRGHIMKRKAHGQEKSDVGMCFPLPHLADRSKYTARGRGCLAWIRALAREYPPSAQSPQSKIPLHLCAKSRNSKPENRDSVGSCQPSAVSKRRLFPWLTADGWHLTPGTQHLTAIHTARPPWDRSSSPGGQGHNSPAALPQTRHRVPPRR